jgi:predicted MPP superfamily phosphohydrolase
MLDALLRAAAFLLGATVVTVVVHGYLYRRLVRDTDLGPPWRGRARVATVAVAALLPAGMVGLLAMRDAPRALAAPLMWCAFGWVGLLLFLLPLMLAGEVVRAAVRRGPPSPDRRRAMARMIGIVGGAASLVLGGVSATLAQRSPLVRRLRAPLRGLSPRMNGYKLVQISDVHVSATIGRGLVDSLVASVNALDPDLVVITGDLVDGSVKELGALVAPFAGLRTRHGVYFVTGNHEYLSGVHEWLEFLPTLGVRVLRNEHVQVAGDDGFDLIGIDDPSGSSWAQGHGPDLGAALRGRDETRASILLAHRPDDVSEASRRGIGLQLSGHTHGGQIAPLGWALERIRQPYVFGLYDVGGTTLYVTSGAGYWGPPMRLATRAEIVLFELVA